MKTVLLSGAAVLALSLPAIADVAAAKAIVDQYSQLPSFESPGDPFDARSCMADKMMVVIPLTSANPFNEAISQGFRDAAEMVGFEIRTWETQLDPAGWIQGINTAVAEGYDLIDLQGGVPPEFLVPQITEARNAGLAADRVREHTMRLHDHVRMTWAQLEQDRATKAANDR